MNKLITGLTLLAGLGLAALAPQAQAGDRHHDKGFHHYVQHDNHKQLRAYRRGYRDARRDSRGQGYAKCYRPYSKRYYLQEHHYRQPRYNYHDTSVHKPHGRVVFRF